MTAQPLYFGPDDRRRFGMLHWPASAVRGAAVILPPIGYEQVCAHTALRVLAERLAADGIATLRPDYDGTGNSLGADTDPARVESWLRSVLDACAALQQWSGVAPIVVGLRMGATFAASVSEAVNPSGLVLWDPVVDGRRYVRAIKLLAGEQEPGAPLSTAGVTFSDDCLADLSGLKVEPSRLGAFPGLWITRSDSDAPDDLPPGLTTLTLPGTDRLLDVDAELSEIPQRTLDEITTWVREHAAAPAEQRAAPTTATRCEERCGEHTLVHRAARLGPNGIFVVETVRDDLTPTAAVILPNNGVAPSVGPGRAWIEFARVLALAGYRVVRMDVGGIGETPAHTGRALHDTYAITAGDDVRTVADELRATGASSVAVLGLCSGAAVGFDAFRAGAHLAAIISINGRFDAPFHDPRPDRARRAAAQTNRVLAVPLSKTPLQPWFDRVPRWVWKGLAALRLVGLPSRMLQAYAAEGGQVLLVFGDGEFGAAALRRRSGDVLDRLVAAGNVELVDVPGLDHSMFRPRARARVLELSLAHLQRVLPVTIEDPTC